MQSILTEKQKAYLLVNNPDLVVKLQADYSVTQYLEDKVMAVMPTVEKLLADNTPPYIIEELCLNQMTRELRPSRFNYIREVLEEDFSTEYSSLVDTGVLTYETINLVEACKEHFETFGFTEETEGNRLLRYAVIATIHDHFN